MYIFSFFRGNNKAFKINTVWESKPALGHQGCLLLRSGSARFVSELARPKNPSRKELPHVTWTSLPREPVQLPAPGLPIYILEKC